MAQRVNHDLQRQALAEAVWHVVRSHGVSGLTVRRVGQEAGWTSGAVQYYFRSRADLLRHAFEMVQVRTLNRLTAQAASVSDDEALRAAVHVLLPITEETRVETEVWFGFLGLALGSPALHKLGRQGHMIVLETMTSQVVRAQRCGVITTALPPETVALEGIALADGLCWQTMYRDDAPSRDQMIGVVDRWLGNLAPRRAQLDACARPAGRGASTSTQRPA